MKGFSDDELNLARGTYGVERISDMIDTIDRIRAEHRAEVMAIEKVSEERLEELIKLREKYNSLKASAEIVVKEYRKLFG